MSSSNKTKPGNPSPSGSYEDELLTWLQYPTDDVFERSYCVDTFQGGWSPAPTDPGTVKSHLDVVNHNTAASIREISSISSALLSKKQMETTSISKSLSCKVSAEEALAQGAARAVGLSSGIAQGTYNKVKTLMQPQHADSTPASFPHYSIKACKESKDHPVKLNLPVSLVTASAPRPLQEVKSMKPNVLELSPLLKTKRMVSESATSCSKRARTECEAHTHTHQMDSSRITEEDIIVQEKMVARARRRCEKSSTSYSGASQSSMSLGGRETTHGGKHKHDLEAEDFAEDDSMDMRKQCKPPSKRNRVAEVHNLSERNRRNRINDKLKTLQDLIPNSTKTDKASVLDEAIEYMKTLQMQLQMVSMRNSLSVSPMVRPMNLPQAQMHMAQPYAIGLGVPIGHASGMGIGLGLGMPEMGPPTATTLSQYPAGMSHLHAMPFYNGSMPGFPHMGFYHNTQIPPTMQNMQEHCELSAQRSAYMHQHQQYEHEQSLQHQPCNLENEALSLEQDDDSDD
ncbi:hypothetical protein L7F22_023592 [Adiantum nelumboides]|nr:hypothetical protein [Adiantum nelumboides]